MNFLKARDKIRQLSFFIPFTVYFVVFFIASFIAYKVPDQDQVDNYTSYSDIFGLLLKVAIAFCTVLISIAFLTVLISYVHFLYHKRRKGIEFKISSDFKEKELHQKQEVRLFIRPVLKPFLGFIKLRLLYDQDRFSEKFSLVENRNSKFFSTIVEGRYHWRLPEIKEYHIQQAIIYFEDVFQFMSIAVTIPANNQFFTQPTFSQVKELRVQPKKTEETNTRIDQLRKIEGEYLNYKNFEDNDDVRRIVWKIYAKNKELVVRIPEIMDPYASHIYLYASFFSHFNIKGNEVVEIPFLNYYKVLTWSVYQNLIKKGFEVRFIPDQELNRNATGDEQQAVKYAVSTSHWHQDKDLKSFVRTNDASVVIISSLSDPDAVKEFIDQNGKDITFLFIKLTDSFKNQNVVDWVQWIFLQSAKNDIERYKRAWSISPLKQKIKENEKVLAQLVARYQEVVEL
jgi:hypothetical protein